MQTKLLTAIIAIALGSSVLSAYHGTTYHKGSNCSEKYEKCKEKCDKNDHNCTNECAEDYAHCRGMF